MRVALGDLERVVEEDGIDVAAVHRAMIRSRGITRRQRWCRETTLSIAHLREGVVYNGMGGGYVEMMLRSCLDCRFKVEPHDLWINEITIHGVAFIDCP